MRSSPEAIQVKIWIVAACGFGVEANWTRMMQPRTAERNSSPVVTICDRRSPMRRPNSPATTAPSSGRKTAAVYKGSALHHVDVFHRDGAAIAEVDDEDREADR